MTGQRVLVVDDDPTITDVLARYLHREGFEVATAAEGDTALAIARRAAPDIVVLDVMLPGIDGLEVVRQLRSFSAAPVILLTALGEIENRIAGFEVGADDYVVKPFSPRELVLRVSAVLRRSAAANAGRSPDETPSVALVDGDLRVDETARTVMLGPDRISLTIREYDLLVHLMRRPAVAMSREELLRDVWGWDFGDTSTVTVHVKRLRAKLGEPAEGSGRIATVWGVGYRFDGAALGVDGPLASALDEPAQPA